MPDNYRKYERHGNKKAVPGSNRHAIIHHLNFGILGEILGNLVDMRGGRGEIDGCLGAIRGGLVDIFGSFFRFLLTNPKGRTKLNSNIEIT
ncbi:MAG: hypothetical protein ACETWK_09410 [Candidatus Aminicenantaceae bacterium]